MEIRCGVLPENFAAKTVKLLLGAELCLVKRIEEENQRLKQLVADLTLAKAMFQDVVQRKS